jgi:hypothetical protein
MTPVPADAPAAPGAHFKLGRPAGTWGYRDAAGDVVGYVHRYDTSDGKMFLPLTWCQHSSHGRSEWRWKSWPVPRPLYGLDRLAARPDAPVLVVEGEKAADAAAEFLPDWIAITSPNGSNAAAKANWLPIAQRRIVIWPDADEAGARYATEVAKALGAIGVVDIKIINPPDGAAAGWDAADAAAEGWTLAQALELVEAAHPAVQALHGAHGSPARTAADGAREEEQEKGSTSRRGKRPPPQRDSLLKIGEALELWHSSDKKCYATVEVKGHRENLGLEKKGFKRWLAAQFYSQTGGVPGSQALADALGVLEQMALEEPEHKPHLRIAGADGKVYLDLGDPSWRAVEVTGKGWQVIDRPQPKFVRSPAMKELPEPEAGASIDAFRGFVNVKTDADYTLMIAFMVGAYRPEGPYPILLINGEQGTAKSTLARMLAQLVDPRAAALRALPRDERELAIAGHNAHLLAFDNVSGLSAQMSDALCRLAAGGGFVTRENYSDAAEVIFDAQRPLVLNGIPDLASRADLSDRALHITLSPIAPEARRTERELFADFEAARPAILGALLDAVSSALRNRETVAVERVERMADFCMWVAAAESGLGWEPGSFIETYRADRAGAVERTIEGDVVASAVVALVERVSLPWEGSATELLAELDREVKEQVRALKIWPKTPATLSGRLRRITPTLRQIGIEVELGDRASTKDRKRLILIWRRGE